MPESVETPAEKLMRQWYASKLAERLMQATSMERNRAMLRRGARLMQTGQLGNPEAEVAEDEPVNIHIGDLVVTEGQQPAVSQVTPSATSKTLPEAKSSLASKLGTAATVAALVLGSGGLGAGLLALLRPQPEAPVFVDTDAQYELRLGSGSDDDRPPE